MTQADRPRLGFVGIGIMGREMVLHLLERGWHVTAWNREPERLGAVRDAGAATAASPRAVAAGSDIVLLCVLHTEAVRACVFGDDGIAAAPGGARLVIDHSTIDPAATRDFAARLHAATGADWIDAPVSGGPSQARAGTLTIMAGGEAEAMRRAAPVLGELGANVTRMGGVGAGQTTKLVNQAIVGAGFVAMAEALVLAEAAGLDAARLPAALAGGLADGPLLARIYAQMQARAFEPPSSYARQLLKDLDAVAAFRQSLALDLPLAEAARQRYAAFVAGGGAMQDSAAVMRLYGG